jgi:hypothetical protein
MRNLYKDVKNTLVMHPRLYRQLFVHFEHDMVTTIDSSRGYTCNKRSILGMELESSVWCQENYAYYFDKQGNVHSLVINWDEGKFNVASI